MAPQLLSIGLVNDMKRHIDILAITRSVLLTATLVALMGSPAFAFSYDLYSFGDSTTAFDGNNNWAPIDYPYGVGHEPSPGGVGEGGEKFDLEGLNVHVDADYVYISLTNSFGYNTSSAVWGGTYRLGDLFIGTNGGNKYEYAIDILDGSAGDLYQVTSWNYIQNTPGSYYNTIYRDSAGAHEYASGTSLGGVTSAANQWAGLEDDLGFLAPGDGDTWVYEFKFDRSLLGDFDSLQFHINVGCGNDLIESSYTVTPEPTTMLLFGLGLAGLGWLRRRS
ncbi:MAG: PEP-CTERM sorting domain-containing protein [Candidatus Zixiibacteriota bacterium]